MIIKVESYPILIASDSHCNNDKLDAIKNKHPEITTRFFLGDLFNFVDLQGRFTKEGDKETGEWLKKNINEWYFVIGNHDAVCVKNWWQYDINEETYNLVAGKFQISYDLIIGDVKYLLLHSKPKSLWDFINPGYQFRELEEDFPNHEEYRASISGHCHKECKHNFIDTDFEIWQVGAARDGDYAILTENGIEFKKL